MGRSLERLEALDVARLAREQPEKTKLHHDGGGLYLCVDKRIEKGDDKGESPASWVFRYTLAGKARTMGLGQFPTIKLAQARKLAGEARRLKALGEDPLETRRAERAAKREGEAKAMTFKDAAQAYIRSHQAGWKNAKHAQQWENTLEAYAYNIIGQNPVAQIDNAAVLRVLQQEVPQGGKMVRLWEAKTETASRLRGRLEAVLGWASAGGFRGGDNPARWKGQLEHQLPAPSKVAKVEHHAALPYADMPEFLIALRAQEGTSAKALEFMTLTATRTGEVTGARWDEIDMERALWTIPGERMKAGREHRVPLSKPALAIVEAMRERRADDSAYVFPGARPGKPLSNMAFLMLLRRMRREDLTGHGLRSTFKDWASETTSFPSELTEMALAHAVGDKVEAAYRRGDMFGKRVELMQAWSDFCEGVK